MNVLHFIPFLVALVVGFVAIKKFGVSDKDMRALFNHLSELTVREEEES